MSLTLNPLHAADPRHMQAILNDPRVRKHMPLATQEYSLDWVSEWLKAKSALWSDPQMGPWAVYLDDALIGWAGVQPHATDAHDMAIVLEPAHWGLGAEVLNAVMERWKSFDRPGALLAFLPESRNVALLSKRWGWSVVSNEEIDGHRFIALQMNV